MIHLHIDGATIEEIYNQCAGILQFPQHNVTVNLTETPADVVESVKKETKVRAPKTEPAMTFTVTFKEVSELISTALPKVGKPKLIEILAAFNCKKGGELKPDQYAAFVEAVTSAIKG